MLLKLRRAYESRYPRHALFINASAFCCSTSSRDLSALDSRTYGIHGNARLPVDGTESSYLQRSSPLLRQQRAPIVTIWRTGRAMAIAHLSISSVVAGVRLIMAGNDFAWLR